MNQFTLLVIVVVAFCYFGGKYCPSALKKNKELLLGVAGGLVLCSFFGLRLEGYEEICTMEAIKTMACHPDSDPIWREGYENDCAFLPLSTDGGATLGNNGETMCGCKHEHMDPDTKEHWKTDNHEKSACPPSPGNSTSVSMNDIWQHPEQATLFNSDERQRAKDEWMIARKNKENPYTGSLSEWRLLGDDQRSNYLKDG